MSTMRSCCKWKPGIRSRCLKGTCFDLDEVHVPEGLGGWERVARGPGPGLDPKDVLVHLSFGMRAKDRVNRGSGALSLLEAAAGPSLAHQACRR